MVYKKIIQKLGGNADEIKYPPKSLQLNNNQYDIMWNIDLFQKSSIDKFPKRPDIYFQDNINNDGLIIDATVVADFNIIKAYNEKMEKYKALQERLLKKRKINAVILPVAISYNGLIHSESVEKLNQLKLNINYIDMINYVIIKSMQNLMFYLGDNLEGNFDKVVSNNPLTKDYSKQSGKMVTFQRNYLPQYYKGLENPAIVIQFIVFIYL